jgi:hypothetical protein
MTNDHIKKLAIECGFYESAMGDIRFSGYNLTDKLQAFAKAIEAQTIDRCADKCEKYDGLRHNGVGEAIRALKKGEN